MGVRELAGAMATLLVGIICSAKPCAAAQSYEVVDLGTLGGTTSYAYGINNDGVVVGQADLIGDALTHAFAIVDDEMVDLGTLGGTWGRAFEISDAGHIIGWAETTGDASVHAFLIENEVMSDLGTLGGDGSQGLDVNVLGQAVGRSQLSSTGPVHATLYGAPNVDLGTWGGPTSNAYSINAHGIIVGGANPTGETGSYMRPFIYQDDDIAEITEVPFAYGTGRRINDAGHIAGWGADVSTDVHAWLVDDEGFHDLGDLGGNGNYPHGLNENGEVVGTAFLPGDTELRAFYWSGGSMVDLNELIPEDSGWVLIEARDINDQGYIVGYGEHNGIVRAFHLTPTPEPATLSLLALGGLALIRRRKRLGNKKPRTGTASATTISILIAVCLLTACDTGFAAVTFFTDKAAWLAEVDNVQQLTTDAGGIAMSNEVSAQPAAGEILGEVLTFDSSNTGLSWSFQLATTQEDYAFVFKEDNNLAIGQLSTYDNDDWEIDILGGPDLRAFAFTLGRNDTNDDETFQVYNDTGQLLGSLSDVPIILTPGEIFLGVISDDSIARISFDEDSGGDDIFISDFRFATPEPASLSLLALGGLAIIRRKKKNIILHKGEER